MLVPINTDAPLYHFPFGTIALILANVVCFLVTGCATDEARLVPWMLEYGNGLNPLGWLSSIFAHASWMHLIGNMFFLWGFGLVVEGKLGLRRFLMLYLTMGLVQSAFVDLLTLHRTDDYVLREVLKEFGVGTVEDFRTQLVSEVMEEQGPDVPPEDAQVIAEQFADRILSESVQAFKGRCLGASGAIFGLMAISLVWAPKNDMHVVGFLFYRVVSFDMAIMYYALLYLAMNLFGLLIDKFAMSTSGLHMVGAVVGFTVGVLYLKKEWVDCERWDLFSVLSGKYGRFADENWGLGAYAHTDKSYTEIPIPESEDAGHGATSRKQSLPEPSQADAPERNGTTPRPRVSKSLQPVVMQIDQGDFIGASEKLFELRLVDSRSQLDQERLRMLAVGLLQAEAPDEAEMYLDEYIERFPEDRSWAVMQMAKLLLKERARPTAALQLLKTLKSRELDPRQLNTAKKIAAECQKQIRAGVEDAEQEW